MPHPSVRLKPGKETPILAGHPWIFSNALSHEPEGEPGQIVEVLDSRGDSLGLGTWNPLTNIRVRMFTKNKNQAIDSKFFVARMKALDASKRKLLPADTDGFRLVHAEADGLPGLIVDVYGRTYVFQIHTAGMDKLRTCIIEAIKDCFEPEAIVERSDLSVRKMEGLIDRPVAVHHGKVEGPIIFHESGIKFFADVMEGQKTGFFLDQREARMTVGKLSEGKNVLNLFGYSGAFSVHAALGGAKLVTTVDISRAALEYAQKNFELNGLDPEDESKHRFLEADVMELLHDRGHEAEGYDLIICDPPAFAKSERQMTQALKAYTDLNTACLKLLGQGGILVTSSCSGRVTPEEFRTMLRIAAGWARKEVRVLDWISQPPDHAERLAFPEGRYLKTAVLEVL